MKKTIKFLSVIIISLLLVSSTVLAAQVNKGDATMSLVEDNVCHISFGKYGDFEKKMIKCDTTNKTVDISLTVKNNAEKLENKKADIVLLIDSSRSMSTNKIQIAGQETTRKAAVLSAANTLVDKLLAVNSKIKIGVVEFATSTELNDEGFTIEGTDKDANTVTTELTSDRNAINTALDAVANSSMGARTNVEVGLDAANKLLETEKEEDYEKYIVVLTDAIPNTSRGVTMDTYSDATAIPTKNKLVELKGKNVNVISMLIDMKETPIAISQENPKPTYKQVAEKIFGTSTTPTAGDVFYVSDEEVEDTVTNKIYASLIRQSYELNNIVIKDYFPKNIIENFAYAKLTNASIGTMTAEVNKEDNSITWTIPKLGPSETGTFSYRLSLKDTFNSEIVGVNLPTNQNVKITFEDNDGPGKAENDKCPIVALDMIPVKDIPQTGDNTILYVVGTVSIVAILGAISYGLVRKNRF